MRFAVAQIGARRHYAIPTFMERAGWLECFHTDLCAELWYLRLVEKSVPERLQPPALRRLLARRVSAIPRRKIRCYPAFAFRKILSRRRVSTSADSYLGWLCANEQFGRLVVSSGLGTSDAVYTFNGAGLEILEWAKLHGLKTVIDQTDAPVEVEEALLTEERENWPGWETGNVPVNVWQRFSEREKAEWGFADKIVCGSSYVAEGVERAGGPIARCKVVPFGFPETRGSVPEHRFARTKKLRVLFVGTLCLRKGIQYLWKAAQELGQREFEFRVVGQSRLTEEASRRLSESLDVIGPVPRSEIGRHFEWADVLVLPSLSEGSANVCYEALAYGVPVITTRNAGSVVRDAREGMIIPIREAISLANALSKLESDRDWHMHLAQGARRRATEFTWEKYSERLQQAVRFSEVCGAVA